MTDMTRTEAFDIAREAAQDLHSGIDVERFPEASITTLTGADMHTATDADRITNATMDSLLRAILQDGRFPNAGRDNNGTGALLLDHEPEMPELDRTYGVECFVGGDDRVTIALLYRLGDEVSVLDQTDPTDAHGLPRALAGVMAEAARRQVAQQIEDAAEDDRHYEAYERAVHERDSRTVGGP